MKYYGLTNLRIERFKAFNKMTHPIRLAPITVLMGINSSGKSSVLQSLLLLKQTLVNGARTDALKIDDQRGVFFTHLVEATFGWPGLENDKLPETISNGPAFELEWEIGATLQELQEGKTRPPQAATLLQKIPSLKWMLTKESNEIFRISAKIYLEFGWELGQTYLRSVNLTSRVKDSNGNYQEGPKIGFQGNGENTFFLIQLPGEKQKKFHSKTLILEYENFIPYLKAENGTTPDARSLYQIFNLFYRSPLAELSKELKEDFSYIGPLRAKPAPSYDYSASNAHGFDTDGKIAGQLLAQKKDKLVHFVPFVEIKSQDDGLEHTILPTMIKEMKLGDALNYYLDKLGFHDVLDTEDNRSINYRIRANKNATIKDIGFGASQILPIIVTGLLSDPLFDKKIGEIPIEEYLEKSTTFPFMIFEQPEIHLHPQAQSLLAQYLVSMALSGRRILIETHSDHLVRRLRGLIARAYNVANEEKLRDLINIVSFNWKIDGTEHVETQIDSYGKFVTWPDGFMTESADEEEKIFLSWIKKEEK